MEAEKITGKIKELMRDPNKIRNIGVVAHIDHGKCVSGDTRIVLSDGTNINAKELYKIAEEKGVLFQNEEDEMIYDIRHLKIQTFSLNKKTGNIEKRRIDLAWKLSGGETTSLKLRNGIKITTSPEHKYLVLDSGSLIEKRGCELSLKDKVVCAKKLKTDSFITEKTIKREMLKELSKKRFYVLLKEDPARQIKKKLMSNLKSYHPKVSEIKYKSFYHGVWKKRYLLKDFLRVCNLLSIGLEEAYDLVNKITFRQGGHRGKSSISVKLPQNFEDLFYIAGLMFGDGSYHKFVVGKPELGKKFKDIIFKEFGVETSLRLYNRTPELVTNRTIVEILNSVFNYPLKNKSHSITISKLVYQSPENFASKFIRGYFDTDGTIEKSRRAISISSASSRMIEDLYFLLLRFGCISQKYYKKNTLYLSGKSINLFIENIGFGLDSKQKRAESIAKRTIGSYIYDLYATSNPIEVRYSKDQLGLIEEKVLLNTSDLAFIEVSEIKTGYEKELFDFTISENHNFVAEGAIIHNTTFSDNLLLGAGMMSEELAGKQLALDFHDDEKERGITIDAANVSMVHNLEGKEYLINLIDTPGHVDFGGDVTRAMRAVDGAIVVCCAVEGIMPQTETVLKQALRERVKPVLFINKVDRLIREVKLTPEEMQKKFMKIIDEVNILIKNLAPEEYQEKWQVNVQEGSVAFGSAFHKWALSFPYMKKKGLSFKNIIDAYKDDSYQELSKKAPVHEVILNMVIRNHPNPKQAQAYRIPKIWKGELESKEGKAMLSCDSKGPVSFIVTKVVIDKHAGEVAAGRLFSGTIKQGDEVYMNIAKRRIRIQQVSVYKGATRVQVDEVSAGNIIGLVGLRDTYAGETISEEPMHTFEAIKHIFEPVVTKSIEAKKAGDLPRLVEVLRQVGKEDPCIHIKINKETGENLMSGMGELHLEVIENRIKREKGLDVKTSEPIVVYREAIQSKSPEIEGKSPNKHNKFYIIVEPLDNNIYQAIKTGDLSEGRIKKKDDEVISTFVKLGVDSKEAKKIKDIFKGNLLVDATRGIVHIGEVMEMVTDAFEQVINEGPLAREPCMKIKVGLTDTKLHEDAIHRGPAQVLPAVRDAIKEAMMHSKPVIFEPLQIIEIDAPQDYMGEISKLVQNKRGTVITMDQKGDYISVRAKLPVAEMFGFTSELRSATNGKGSHYLVDQIFEKLPESLQEKIRQQIRKRKGLSENA
ncbi:MAG: elongation factor EF-2 [Nanoarchaeota archaeon]|nr:elongation factor EF-2 [Nanoarchaeota archaeon]